MTDRPTRVELAVAVLAGATGVAGSYALAGYSRQFVVAPIDALVVRLTPGPVVAWMIQNVGAEAHLLHVGLSVAVATGLLAGAALAGIVAGRRFGRQLWGVALAGGLAWGVTTAVTVEPVLAVGAAVPVALGTAAASREGAAHGTDLSRRRALRSGASALAFVGLAAGLDRFRSGPSGADGSVPVGSEATASPPVSADAGGTAAPESEPSESDGQSEIQQRLQQAADRSLDVAGDVPGLVSSFEEFYNTDIAQFDPDLSAGDWSVTVTGEVERELTLDFAALTDMPTEHRFVTLRCVGERLNGHKLDTAVWTGTPIAPLLDEVDPGGECGCVMLHAEDDYFVQFPVSALEDGFLAWGMNGEPLPQSHGRPVRVLIPGHWGEVNVKWLSEIELLDEAADGYWERRGWHGTGPVNTVAKLWSDTVLDSGAVELAGHAYAGTRGIDRVEVSTDGGDTWRDAELSEPLPGEDVWRQWRHEFDPSGSHEVVVRAVDGEGTVQPEERSESFPSGATGWVSKTVDPA